MKRLISIFFLVGFIVVGCGPTAEQRSTQTSIAFTETASSWTKTPTATQTPTATPTNTPTATFTPTPTPIGGGGRIYLYAPIYFFDKNSKPEGNYYKPETDYGWFSVNIDGSGLTSREKPPIFSWVSVSLASSPVGSYPHSISGSQPHLNISPATEPTLVTGSKIVRLFSSPDNSTIYWATGDWCKSRGLCNEHYYRTNPDGSELQEIWQNIKNSFYKISISPSGRFIAFDPNFTPNRINFSKDGCYTATIDGQNVTRVANELTWGCIWSPKDDKLLFNRDEGEGTNNKKNYYLLSMADGSIEPLPDIQTKLCYDATWVSSTQILLFTCMESSRGFKSTDLTAVGPRLVDLERSAVTVFPSIGFCAPPAISPDRRWAIFSNCDEGIDGKKPLPSQLLNLENGETEPIFNGLIPIDPLAVYGYGLYWLP